MSSTPCRAAPSRRKNVPYNGPLAPPTVLTRVIPTFLNSASAVSSPPPSIAATTAFMPRSMFAPWSASPMAESSSVSSAAFSWMTSAYWRSHCENCSTVTAIESNSPSQSGGVDGRVPQSDEVVVGLQQRDRAARHLERRDVVADQRPGDRDSRLVEQSA